MTSASKERSAQDDVKRHFDVAAARLGLDAGTSRMLCEPWRDLRVSLPVRMDDGRIEVFTGYRVQHNGARGPYKGGLRYHPLADEDEVRALATPDDLEDRSAGSSLWRSQGGHPIGPPRAQRAGTQRGDSALCPEYSTHFGPLSRHPRS